MSRSGKKSGLMLQKNIVCEEYITEYENHGSVDNDTQMADKASDILSYLSNLHMQAGKR
jgi:hypothetical protein